MAAPWHATPLPIGGPPGYAAGKFGNAMSFSAPTQTMSLPAPGPADVTGGAAFTAECWVNAATVGTGYQILNRAASWFLAILGTGFVRLNLQGIGSIANAVNICDGAWHHIAIVYNGSTWSLYVDGTSVGSTLTGYSPTAGTQAGTVGPPNSTGTLLVDEIRFSNSTRYTTNFTPSATPFVAGGATVALYHLDNDPYDYSTGTLPPAPLTGVTAATAASVDTITYPAATAGTNPVYGYALYVGSTTGTESGTAYAVNLGAGAGSFTHASAALSSTNFYYVKAFDGASTPNYTPASNEVSIAIGAAATYLTLTGPIRGAIGVQSTNYTVTLAPAGGTLGATTINLSDGGAGGTFAPGSLSLSTGTPSGTFKYTPAAGGSPTLTASGTALASGTLGIYVPAAGAITLGFSAPYGTVYTGLAATLGYTVYDLAGAVLVPRQVGTGAGVVELPTSSGIYVVGLPLSSTWQGVVVWDVPSGSGFTAYYQTFGALDFGFTAAAVAAAVQTGLNAQGYTAARAPHLDNLDIGGDVASSAELGTGLAALTATLGSPAGASVSADIAAVEVLANDAKNQTTAGALADAAAAGVLEDPAHPLANTAAGAVPASNAPAAADIAAAILQDATGGNQTVAGSLGAVVKTSNAIFGGTPGTVVSATSGGTFVVSLGGASIPGGTPFANLALRFVSGANGVPITQTQPIATGTVLSGNVTAELTFAVPFTATPSPGDLFELV